VPESWNGRSRKSAFSLRGNDGSNLPPSTYETVEMWPPLADTIAALRGYGLIEKDDGADRIHISDLAAVIFESQEAEALQRTFAAAGLNPEIIADYAANISGARAGRQMRSASLTCRRGTDLPRGQPKASCGYLTKPCGSLAVVRPGFSPPFRRACDRCRRFRRGSGSAILCKHPPIRLIKWRLGAGSCGLPMANAISTWRKVSPDTPCRRSRGCCSRMVGSFAAGQVRKLFHRVSRPTEAPPFMRGYSRADLPYEQPTNTDPDGECGSCWQDDIIINHFQYEPCYPHKERRHNDP
jgi:hypothetical protein